MCEGIQRPGGRQSGTLPVCQLNLDFASNGSRYFPLEVRNVTEVAFIAFTP